MSSLFLVVLAVLLAVVSASQVPIGTVYPDATFTFTDNSDALSCLATNILTNTAVTTSAGGDIFVFSLPPSNSPIAASYVAGAGATGANWVGCEMNYAGNIIYLLDTRGIALYSFLVNRPKLAPVLVASFPDEVIGSLTSMTVDNIAHVAYVGTRNTDLIYSVNLTATSKSYRAFNAAQMQSDITALALSATRRTLYVGTPAPAEGSAGSINSMTVLRGMINDPTLTPLYSSVKLLYPTSLFLNGTFLYIKDGGALHGLAGPNANTVQTLGFIKTGTDVYTQLFNTTTDNLPNGMANALSNGDLYFTTSNYINSVTLLRNILS